jgi:ABC-type multidrug transport system fused ATPase/permease subunit
LRRCGEGLTKNHAPKEMNNLIFTTIRRILQVLPPGYKIRSAKMMVLLFFNSVLELFGLAAFLPLFSVILQEGVIYENQVVAKVYQMGGFSNENQFILTLAGFIVFVILFKNVISLFILQSQARFSFSLYQYFSIRLHQFFYSKGFAFFKSTNSNLIMRDLDVVPERFANNMVLAVFIFLNEMFVLSFILITLVLYDWRAIVLLGCSILPVFLLFYNWVKERSTRVEEGANGVKPLLHKSIFQSVFGFIDVEITNSQSHFRSNIRHLLDQLVQLSIKRVVYGQAPTKVIESGMVLAIFTITAYGLFFLPGRADLVTLLGLFALAAYRILPSVNRIMIALMNIKGHQYTFDAIMQIKGYKPEECQQREVHFNTQFQLKDLSFCFPDQDNELLKHIDLTIHKGESIGIIGSSGSGKTTLMNLMLGFWRPTTGEINIDGLPLDESTLKSWRDKIGYVQQEVYLLDGTLAENVAFGESPHEIDNIKLEQSMKQASLWEFSKTLPDGTATMVGERGTNLSGGQRQRVGIARALYSGAQILFLDEATSALDSQTEEEITESIRNLSDGNLTLVVIAHRLSTLKYCSRIVVIDAGRVVEKEDHMGCLNL